MYGLIAYAAAAALALAVAFGTGWSYGAKGPKADLAQLEAKVAREDAMRVQELAKRRTDDERAIARLREVQAESEGALRRAVDRAADADKRAAALAAKLRASPAGGCLLPPDARRLWNDAALPGGGAANRPAAPADRETHAPRAPAAGTDAADSVAPPDRDNAPADCVTTWEVGRRNTARAAFNADALDACNAELIGTWQACTGKTYKDAP